MKRVARSRQNGSVCLTHRKFLNRITPPYGDNEFPRHQLHIIVRMCVWLRLHALLEEGVYTCSFPAIVPPTPFTLSAPSVADMRPSPSLRDTECPWRW